MDKVYCVECGVGFEPDHQNLLDGLDHEAYMCDSCMVVDANPKEDDDGQEEVQSGGSHAVDRNLGA
jgi:hypothetical protein